MKRVTLGLMVAALVLTAGVVQAQPCCAAKQACFPSAADTLLVQALALQLAEDVGFSAEDTMVALEASKDYCESLRELKDARKAAVSALSAALDAGEMGASVSTMLAELKEIDGDIAMLNEEAVELTEDYSLTTAQQASLYVFVTCIEGKVCAAKKALMGSPPCAAGAPAACAAPAAAAVSPEQAIQDGLTAFSAGFAGEDIEDIMKSISDDFEHYEWGDKDGLRDFLEQAIDMGYLEDLEIITEDTEIRIDDDEATAYPVDLEGAFGSVTLELVFTKEGDTWMITGMDASGI